MNWIIITALALVFVQLVSSQDACTDAQLALATDSMCVNSIDAATVCKGTCWTLYDNIITSCDNAVSL